MGESLFLKRLFTISSLKEKVSSVGVFTVYLLIEAASFALLFAASIALAHWTTRLITLCFRYTLGNIGQAYLVIYSIGICSPQITKYSKSWCPTSVTDYRRKYLIFFGSLRLGLIFFGLFGSTVLLFYSYYEKHGQVESSTHHILNEDDEYFNNVIFLLFLSLLAFTSSRIIEMYRQFNKRLVQRKSTRVVRSPDWLIYLFYFGSLTIMELIFAGIFLVILIGIAIVVQLAFGLEWLTYLLTCIFGSCLGHAVGVMEELFFPFDEYYGRFEPYFTTIHWDSRLNVVVFSLLPCSTRWYFSVQFEGENALLYNFTCFVGCISTTGLFLAKYHTLFSFTHGEPPRRRRVHPAGGEDEDGRRRHHPEVSLISNVHLFFRSFLVGHLRSRHGSSPGRANNDHLSATSTGTCTTLMLRMNNSNDRNNNDEIDDSLGQPSPDDGELPRTVNAEEPVSTPPCPRSPKSEGENINSVAEFGADADQISNIVKVDVNMNAPGQNPLIISQQSDNLQEKVLLSNKKNKDDDLQVSISWTDIPLKRCKPAFEINARMKGADESERE